MISFPINATIEKENIWQERKKIEQKLDKQLLFLDNFQKTDLQKQILLKLGKIPGEDASSVIRGIIDSPRYSLELKTLSITILVDRVRSMREVEHIWVISDWLQSQVD